MTTINGETQIIGFFGETFKTSKMYAIYNAAFRALKLNYIYVPLMVKDLKKAVEGIRHLGIKAVGVTIPYKIKIIKYLDELDKDAKRIGAINVVINKNGKLIGGNTDGLGAVKALKEKTEIAGKKVIILGAGGAARAIAFAISDEGGELTILNRSIERVKNLAKTINCRFGGLTQLEEDIENTDILINATPVGITPKENESLVKKEWLKPSLVVQELVSKPRKTKLTKEAREAGCKVVYADRMLLWQAVYKFKYYTGREPPVKVMEKSLESQT